MGLFYFIFLLLLHSDPLAEAADLCGDSFLALARARPEGSVYQTIPMRARFRGENRGEIQGGIPVDPVKYLRGEERKKFKITVGPDGRLLKSDGLPLNTCNPPTDDCPAAIYAMDETGEIFVHTDPGLQKDQTEIAHSSLLAGDPVAAAGEVTVIDGQILLANIRSGHYHPKEEHLKQFISELRSRGADLSKLR